LSDFWNITEVQKEEKKLRRVEEEKATYMAKL